ncbi:hypothetical protein [Sphingobium sp. HDIP04]|uniref:hypothetical protein n=1 Tax=Sphingobium sp. HDIP04 TaxID=428994 RepID=UPI00040CA8D5|nr:hypothetical protein [Sphingobium sp. HDIP04]
MPRFLIEGSSDGSLFAETIDANSKEDAEAFAIERLCEAWGETYGPDTTLDDLGDAASVTEYSPDDYARDAAPGMLAILREIMTVTLDQDGDLILFADDDGTNSWADRIAAIIAAATGSVSIGAALSLPGVEQTPSANEPEATLSAQIAGPIDPPELPAGITFNEANLETAMCLWEAMLEIRDRPDIAARFEEVGTVAMRHAVMTLIADCEREWEAARGRDEDHSPYDWEWCPAFLERNLSRLGIDAVEG